MGCWADLLGSWETCKEDLKPVRISKVHFLKSEWEDFAAPLSVSFLYLTWRWVYLVYCLFAVIVSTSFYGQPKLWPIFLTNWSLTCQLIYGLLSFVNLICFKISSMDERKSLLETISPRRQAPALNAYTTFQTEQPNDNPEMGQAEPAAQSSLTPEESPNLVEGPYLMNNKVESVIWVLASIVGTLPYFVTLGYWFVIYPKEEPKTSAGLLVTVLNHGINAGFALLDTAIISIPVRVTHVLYLLSFGFTYGTFSWVYDIAGGKYKSPETPYIYPILDWHETPGRAVLAIIFAFPVMLMLYYAYWVLYILRLRLAKSDAWTCFRGRNIRSI